jgi:hypothetical protein
MMINLMPTKWTIMIKKIKILKTKETVMMMKMKMKMKMKKIITSFSKLNKN